MHNCKASIRKPRGEGGWSQRGGGGGGGGHKEEVPGSPAGRWVQAEPGGAPVLLLQVTPQLPAWDVLLPQSQLLKRPTTHIFKIPVERPGQGQSHRVPCQGQTSGATSGRGSIKDSRKMLGLLVPSCCRRRGRGWGCWRRQRPSEALGRMTQKDQSSPEDSGRLTQVLSNKCVFALTNLACAVV